MPNSQDVAGAGNEARAPNVAEAQNTVGDPEAPVLTIVTLNIQKGGIRIKEKEEEFKTLLKEEKVDLACVQEAHKDLCEPGKFPEYKSFPGAAEQVLLGSNTSQLLQGRQLILIHEKCPLASNPLYFMAERDDTKVSPNVFIRLQRAGQIVNVHNGSLACTQIKDLETKMHLSAETESVLIVAGDFNRKIAERDAIGGKPSFAGLENLVKKQNLVDVVHDDSDKEPYWTMDTGRNDRIYIRAPNMPGDHDRMHIIGVYKIKFVESDHDPVVCKLRMSTGKQQQCGKCVNHKDQSRCRNCEKRCYVWLSTCPKCKNNVHVTKPYRCKDQNYLTRCDDKTFHPLEGVWCTDCKSAGVSQMSDGAAEAPPVASGAATSAPPPAAPPLTSGLAPAGTPSLSTQDARDRVRHLLREVEQLAPALDHRDLPTFLSFIQEAQQFLPRDGHKPDAPKPC